MLFFSALTRFAQLCLVLGLLAAYSANALASVDIRDRGEIFSASSHQLLGLQKELGKDENFPAWLLKTDRSALLKSFAAAAQKAQGASENLESEEIVRPQASHSPGVFSSFFINHIDQFKSVCSKALSLEECKPLVWEKAKVVMGKAIASSVEDAVNELLFRKDNPFVEELKVPEAYVLKSLRLKDERRGQFLDEYLSRYKSEFNIGAYAPGLINNHPTFAKAKKLLGAFSPKELNWLFFGPNENTALFERKLKRARNIFESEWKSFSRDTLVPSAMLDVVASVGKDWIVAPSNFSTLGFPLLSGYVCFVNQEFTSSSPEFSKFCHFVFQKVAFQKKKIGYSLL